ncbi:MAG TPA: aminotransferase class V-fold PLP-dependent enzyme, partial [Ignavibacteria bacterium]|nr:aminotransferase class V-fold PLP-dependent enzyme [Ignavibacteria bacterium]
MDINTIREYFPYLKKGKIYFNHAATAPMSVPLIRELNKVLTGKSESNIDNYPEFLTVVDDTKSKLALLINTQPDRIGFLDNTSNGINILAQGIPWRKGDRILLNNVEFPANVYPFLNLRDQGVDIDFVKAKNGIVTAEDI